jgi:sec-independent protein translocase protein TatA
MGNIGWQGAIIILVVLLVVFGPKRLPEMGRSLGRGMREFKDSVTGSSKDSEQPTLTQSTQAPVQPAQAPAQPPAQAPVQPATPAPEPAPVEPTHQA